MTEFLDQLEALRKEIENENLLEASRQALRLTMTLDASCEFKVMSCEFAQIFVDILDVISNNPEMKKENYISSKGEYLYIPKGILLLLKEELKREPLYKYSDQLESFRSSMELLSRSVLGKKILKEKKNG